MDALAITARTADKIPTARQINEIFLTGRQRRQTDWTIALSSGGENTSIPSSSASSFDGQRFDSGNEVANFGGPLPPGLPGSDFLLGSATITTIGGGLLLFGSLLSLLPHCKDFVARYLVSSDCF